MDPRLQAAIGSARIRLQAGDLVRLSLAALDDLRSLDDGLYERFVATREAPKQGAATAAGLRELWNDTFRGLLRLIALCRTFATTRAPDPEPELIPEVDFGELGPAAAGPEAGGLELGSSDIGDLLDGLDGLDGLELGDDTVQPSSEDQAELRWDVVMEKVGSIEYGLRSQYGDATTRMESALAAGETNTVLGLLDDAQSSASEGVHALVAAVYQAFSPDVDTATVVPGYLTSLGRALLVRRGIAELSKLLTPHNSILQSANPAAHPAALAATRVAVHEFVTSPVGRAMRPADRWQMVEFDRALASEPAGAARLTSEGLVKYLESLGSINQREVLQIHDRRALEQMRESLANAHQLIDLSPRTAREMIAQAYQSAQRLRGRHPVTDELLGELARDELPTVSASGVRAFMGRLQAVLAASGP